MALSGDLRFVPLDEVLRLSARAGQKASIEVSGDDVNGRIFVTKKGIALATIIGDKDLRQHLINSNFVDDDYLERVESGQADFGPQADNESGLKDLLRETTVESIYQMNRHGSFFEVEESAETPYAASKPFELEGVLEDVRKRSDEWAEVTRVLSDLEAIITITRDLGDRDEVNISRDAWKVLSELGSGSSVPTMAARLGTTDFWTARVAADMAALGLLDIADQASDVEATQPEDQWTVPVVETPIKEVEAREDDIDRDESWWMESEPEPAEVDEDSNENDKGDEQGVKESSARLGLFAERRYQSANDEPAGEQQAETPEQASVEADSYDEVEENAETFLERVFSEVDSDDSSEPDPPRLGRRKRLGSMLGDRTDTD